MDEYGSEGLEAHTDQIMTFLGGTKGRQQTRDADPNKRLKRKFSS